MATNPCRNKKTDLDLRLIRTHWDDMLLKGTALTRLLRKLRSSPDKSTYRYLAQVADRLEMAGQILEAATKPSISSILEAVGTMAELDETAAQRDEFVEDLGMAAKALGIAQRQFEDSRERYQESFERFWMCTEKHRPRRVTLDVTLDGTMNGPMARATMARRWAVEAKVVPDAPPDAPYDDRLLRWLVDPSLTELLRGRADVQATMPAYDWVAARPEVEVEADLPVFSGGPLVIAVAMIWSRDAPTRVRLRVGAQGEQLVRLRVTFTTHGQTSAINGEQDVAAILRTQLLRHDIGGKYVTAAWEPDTTSWRYEKAIASSSGKGGSRCVVVVTTGDP